jgi:hypothetical protein
MNLEKIAEPITSKSIEEHEQSIQEKLQRIQLEYVDGIFSKRVAPAEIKYTSYEKIDGKEVEIKKDLRVNDFKFLLNRYTSVLRELMDVYIKNHERSDQWDSKMYDKVEEDFKDKIFGFYKNDHENWIDKTLNMIIDTKKEIKDNLEINETENNLIKGEMPKAGLLTFDPDVGYKELFRIEAEDITNDDYGISIHLDPLFKTNLKETNKNLFSSHSLENLSEQIIDKYPETKAIFARSWIMDTPIAKRIGFTIYPSQKDEDYTSPAFWYQFINDKGQINIERVNKFIGTGVPPYKVKIGMIRTKDFLQKYLPKERRGKITLKEIDLEIVKEHAIEKKSLDKLWENWNNITESEVESIINKSFSLKEFDKSTLLESNINPQESFCNLLKEFKKEKKSFIQLENDARIKVYIDKFRVFFINLELKDKEVIIE